MKIDVHLNDLLTIALRDNQLEILEEQQQQLINYLLLLQHWNRVFNLTTITKPREMVYLHLIDSLAILPFLQGTHLLDVGSGAGLPGVPLAIVTPQLQWVLLDKNSKKTRFLTQAVAELGLKNVSVVHETGEHFKSTVLFDSILSRAFGTITYFMQTTAHLLAPQGIFIAMKGKYPQEELDELPPGFMVQRIKRLEIKGMSIERHVICLQTNMRG